MIELKTILIEVEAVLNSRPLTYPYVDINDASSLIPSHFLCGHRLLTLPDTSVSVKESDPDYISTDVSTKELTKRARYHEIVIRWQKEYLTSNKTAVAIRDVVLMRDNVPRVVTDLH